MPAENAEPPWPSEPAPSAQAPDRADLATSAATRRAASATAAVMNSRRVRSLRSFHRRLAGRGILIRAYPCAAWLAAQLSARLTKGPPGSLRRCPTPGREPDGGPACLCLGLGCTHRDRTMVAAMVVGGLHRCGVLGLRLEDRSSQLLDRSVV